MTDIGAVLGAYFVVLGSLVLYALALRRRSAEADAATRTVERRDHEE
ncbi:MAG: hypothetical protein ACRDGQ_03195 [Candidatus Limnocylindrales bacterium]